MLRYYSLSLRISLAHSRPCDIERDMSSRQNGISHAMVGAVVALRLNDSIALLEL